MLQNLMFMILKKKNVCWRQKELQTAVCSVHIPEKMKFLLLLWIFWCLSLFVQWSKERARMWQQLICHNFFPDRSGQVSSFEINWCSVFVASWVRWLDVDKTPRKGEHKWIIYVEGKKAIYGTMSTELLAYKKMPKLFFREWGY